MGVGIRFTRRVGSNRSDVRPIDCAILAIPTALALSVLIAARESLDLKRRASPACFGCTWQGPVWWQLAMLISRLSRTIRKNSKGAGGVGSGLLDDCDRYGPFGCAGLRTAF